MSSHSIAEAGERLPELVERVLRGEPVAALRPAAATRPAEPMPRRTPADSLGCLRQHRVGRLRPGAPDAGALVGQMRDEDRG